MTMKGIHISMEMQGQFNLESHMTILRGIKMQSQVKYYG